ncbi:hypothetical protein ACWFR1_15030 [Streptomyces sp. NPDC055103]
MANPEIPNEVSPHEETSPERSLLALIVADPGHLPEILAGFAVRRRGPSVPASIARLRRELPDAGEAELQARVVARGRRRVVSEGSVVGGPFVVLIPLAFCGALLAQARTVLELAALDGRDPTAGARAAELLVLQGVYEDTRQAREALARAGPPADAPTRRRRWVALWGVTLRMARLLGLIVPGDESQGQGGHVRRVAARAWRWVILGVVILVGMVAPLVWLPYMAMSYRRADARMADRVLAYYFGDSEAARHRSAARPTPEAAGAGLRTLLSLLVPLVVAAVTFLTGVRIAGSSWPVLGIVLAVGSTAVGACWYRRRARRRRSSRALSGGSGSDRP